MEKPYNWKEFLFVAEVAFNNGHYAYLGMIPFESVYGRKYIIPVN